MAGLPPMIQRILSPRWVLLMCLGVMWLNYAFTSRWAHVVGSIHGTKEPVFLGILALLTIVVVRGWPAQEAPRRSGQIALLGGLGLLIISFFHWFPLRVWTQLPFQDNWPTRFQVTADGLALYAKGAFVGWQWDFLGGYPSSSDISQTLSTIAALPMALFGDRVGFHLIHLLVLIAIPVLVYLDLRLDRSDRNIPAFAAGLAAVTLTGWFSYFITRSGDTNSMSGAFCAIAALAGSHGAAAGRRWGVPLLVGAMALIGHCHTAFLVYTAILLGVESIFYRDVRRLLRGAIAVAVAIVAALPLTYETWRYPSFVNLSNAGYPTPEFVLEPFLRQIYYNIELLFLPHRWFNDFTGLLHVMLPAVLLTAFRRRDRTGFYAWATLAVIGLTLLNHPLFGFAFVRPIHLLAVLPAVPIAAFILRLKLPRVRLALLAGLILAYVQISWIGVPHITARRDFDPQLIDYMRTLDGATVLLENAFHRDMDADETRRPERTPFMAHAEAVVARETGKRLYAGLSDGWQYSVFRPNLLAGGAFQGRLITTWPPASVADVLRKWGIRYAVVWSGASNAFFSAQPEYARRWTHGHWTAYEFLHADPREVVVAAGSGTLADRDWLGATIRLRDVQAGSDVVVRTHYYPAWSAATSGVPVPLFARNEQLAFTAPRSGTYDVILAYPKRPWLMAIAVGAILVGLAVCWSVPTRPDASRL
jgi:hypothetical protein